MRDFRRVLTTCLLATGLGCGGAEAPPAADQADQSPASAATPAATGGSLSALLAGEQRSWNVLVDESARGPSSSSTWQTRDAMGRTLLTVAVTGYPGSRPTVAGMIALTMATSAEPGSCPCRLMLQGIEYWESPSAMYRARDARISLDRLELVRDGVYRAEGTFSGTLVPDDTFEDAKGPRTIEGSFSIDRIVAAGGDG